MPTDIVTSSLDDGSAGTLRQVLGAAAPGDTIVFASALSGDTIGLQSPLVISSSVTIDGTAGSSRVALSGRDLGSILVVQGGTVTVENATLEFGTGTGADGTASAAPTDGAGAVLLSGGQLTLNAVLLEANTAVGGAGVPATDTAPGGKGADAGTVLVTGGSLIVQDSTLDGNTATGGTGGGSPLFDSQFASPFAGATGGDAAAGIFVEVGSATITGTTISSNAGIGGTGGTGESAVSGSEAGGAGGGVGGNAAGVFYNRGSIFAGGNTYASNTGREGDGGGGGYGGSGHFARNNISYNNGGGVGGFGGGKYSPAGAGYSGTAGSANDAYAGLTVGQGGAGGAQGSVGSFGGAGTNAGGGGGGGGGGAGCTSASLGAPIEPVACFAVGTRIATTRGEVAVEHLHVGDRVVRVSGAGVPVVWLGHRRVDCRAHPAPREVMPVRVSAGAFAPGQPRRDLLLSPDHAVFVDGALIPVRYLVNGHSIVQQRVEEVTYYHVELPAHAVILADGLPCESYLDTGNRAVWDGSFAVTVSRPKAVAAAGE